MRGEGSSGLISEIFRLKQFEKVVKTVPEFILHAKGIEKNFSGVRALMGVDLSIEKGSIHCLAGENGCGKSTLIKIISGVHPMDGGSLEINGKQYEKINPIEAIKSGIQVIYQDLSLFPNLTVMENLAYNTELAENRKFVSWARIQRLAEEAISKIDFSVDLKARVSDLSIADKQMIAISRALLHNAKLIIMDEPTTALTRKEVNNLFRIIKDLQSKGISIMFVSHKLDEVFEISDAFTILRNGENVKSGLTSELDNKSFSYYMTGKEFEDKQFENEIGHENPRLEVENLTLKHGFSDVSFSLYPGEIIGISGLMGSGRTELAMSLFGIYKADSGKIKLDGKELSLSSVQDALNEQIGYVPEDRLTEGLFMSQSIGDNIIISRLEDLSNKVGALNFPAIRKSINDWVQRLKIKTPNSDNVVQTLSGGNQQRVVIAKWMSRDLKVLILNGPTVGVDIGSKADLHEVLKDAARQGIGLIVLSDDLPEIMSLCNRVMVMKAGKITGRYNIDELDLSMLTAEIQDVDYASA